MKIENLEDESLKDQLPLNVKLAREVSINNLKHASLIESSYHQTTQLESQHFYKPISRLLERHG